MPSQPAHLEPSELGTKEYWDTLYTTELRNHAADSSDIGTCWFDDSDAQARTLRFLKSLSPDSFSNRRAPDSDSDSDEDQDDEEDENDNQDEDGDRTTGAGRKGRTCTVIPPLSRRHTAFLDLGCGNGALLFALRDAGWQGRMLGIDYSPQSISLARQIARSRTEQQQSETNGVDDKNNKDDKNNDDDDNPPQTNATANATADEHIDFAEWDLLAGPMHVTGPRAWDVVLDKGTFDAISLSGPAGSLRAADSTADRRGTSGTQDGAGQPCISAAQDGTADAAARRPVESYRERMLALVKPGGLFVITSCNWTEDELRAWFERGAAGLENGHAHEQCRDEPFTVVGKVEYPTFTFGGVKGQTITTLCFQRGR